MLMHQTDKVTKDTLSIYPIHCTYTM